MLVALAGLSLEAKLEQMVATQCFLPTLRLAAVAALEAALHILGEMADQAVGQEETQQAQVVLETRLLPAQVKEATEEQHQVLPAAVGAAEQVRQEALELLAQIIKAVMAVMGRQTPSQAHPLLTLGVAAVALIQLELALEEQAAVEQEGCGQFLLQQLEQQTLVVVAVVVLMDRQVLEQTVDQVLSSSRYLAPTLRLSQAA